MFKVKLIGVCEGVETLDATLFLKETVEPFLMDGV
jgi:hypothetical protein